MARYDIGLQYHSLARSASRIDALRDIEEQSIIDRHDTAALMIEVGRLCRVGYQC